eukprot:1153119-Pelagomonas_calceolata.AAC.12
MPVPSCWEAYPSYPPHTQCLRHLGGMPAACAPAGAEPLLAGGQTSMHWGSWPGLRWEARAQQGLPAVHSPCADAAAQPAGGAKGESAIRRGEGVRQVVLCFKSRIWKGLDDV